MTNESASDRHILQQLFSFLQPDNEESIKYSVTDSLRYESTVRSPAVSRRIPNELAFDKGSWPMRGDGTFRLHQPALPRCWARKTSRQT